MISNKTNQAIIHEILEGFAKTGIAQLKDSLEKLFNQLMIAEREDHIGAGPYERTPERNTYSNGFKDKMLLTRSGKLHLQVPQVRDGDFYPSCLEKGCKINETLPAKVNMAHLGNVNPLRK